MTTGKDRDKVNRPMKLDIGEYMATDEVHDSEPDNWLTLSIEHNDNDIVANANNLPFKDNMFNEILSGKCIMVYTNETALSEAVRVLRPGKMITLTVYKEQVKKTMEQLTRLKCHTITVKVLNYAKGFGLDFMITGYKNNEHAEVPGAIQNGFHEKEECL